MQSEAHAMTSSPTFKLPTNKYIEEREDLTGIRGIETTKQQWLEFLGICTIRDLAGASADQIESRLRDKGHIISEDISSITRSEIEGWIAQAQEFTAELSSQQAAESPQAEAETLPSSTTEEGETSQPIVEPPKAEAETSPSLPTEEEEPSQPIVEPPEAEKLAVKTPVTVEIAQVRAFQPPWTRIPMVVNNPGQGFSNPISSGEPFALEIAFGLSELNGADIAKQQVACCVQFYTRHRFTGAITHLGDTKANILVEGQTYYTAVLPETTLQEQGMHRLQVLVTLQGVPAPPAFFEVPLLQVV